MKLPWRSLLRFAACLGWLEAFVFAITHGAVQGVIASATALCSSLATLHAHISLPDRWTRSARAGVSVSAPRAGTKLQPGPLIRPLARTLAWVFGMGLAMAGSVFVVRLLQQKERAAAGA